MVLIDVSSASVAGAYAVFKKGQKPSVIYTKRIPIGAREGEPRAEDMERTLAELTQTLIKEGAPVLARSTGSGRVRGVLACIGAPWQETNIHTETIEPVHPFTFTRNILEETERTVAEIPRDRVLSEESVIATLLNGYEVSNPFGKRVERADLLILSSTLDAKVTAAVSSTLRKAYHTRAIRITAFSPVAYTVFRDVYPHEKDYLIFSVGGETSDITLVKRGLLASSASTTHGLADMLRAADRVPAIAREPVALPTDSAVDPAHDLGKSARITAAKGDWVAGITSALAGIAKDQALPRTLFLLAEEGAQDFLKTVLDEGPFRTLLLSDEPLAIIPVVPQHFAPYVNTRGEAEGDVPLAMLALFHNKSPLRG
jgi:hypothetical protein